MTGPVHVSGWRGWLEWLRPEARELVQERRSRPPPALWDVGLQPERSALAWQRTSLSLAGVTVLTFRGLATSGQLLLLVVVGGIALALTSLVAARARRRRRVIQRVLERHSGAAGLIGARLLFVTAFAGGLLAVTNLALVLYARL